MDSDNWLTEPDDWLTESDDWLTESDDWLTESDNKTFGGITVPVVVLLGEVH